MGWWGVGIMEGDSPLDAKGDIFDALGFDYASMEDDPTPEQIKVALDQQQLIVLDKLVENEFDNFIDIQVLGYLIVTTGAKLEHRVKQAVLEAIANDDWLEDDRQQKLEEFRNIIENYYTKGGTPVEIGSTGLFQKIFEAMHDDELPPDDED